MAADGGGVGLGVQAGRPGVVGGQPGPGQVVEVLRE
jgi:hypothetical protein